MREDRLFLEDIQARIDLIRTFTAAGREAFMASRLIQEAVLRSLEIIGEASRQLSQALREAHPEVPWRQIIAFRNFVAHAYWDIRPERVWEIVERDLQPLQEAINAILAELSSKSSHEGG
ncbi:MAG: DUF86 domain-containing protein [Anaerolineae bacterium]|nr:DUF86 domain-containing protein [Anaerolineae bacterium]MDW8299009.1 DUF86 domain-containing protein [Anaerolineae bacterium]